MTVEARPLSPRLVVHQEGLVGVVAIAGLAFTAGGPLRALAPSDGLAVAVLSGSLVGLLAAALTWLFRFLPAQRRLEEWQRQLVGGWAPSESAAVAVLSGLSEEALVRALLQPIIGLWPASLVFALLHVVPVRTLWLWPVMAFGLGLVLGLLFARFGYPAAASAHLAFNLVGLLRLRDE